MDVKKHEYADPRNGPPDCQSNQRLSSSIGINASTHTNMVLETEFKEDDKNSEKCPEKQPLGLCGENQPKGQIRKICDSSEVMPCRSSEIEVANCSRMIREFVLRSVGTSKVGKNEDVQMYSIKTRETEIGSPTTHDENQDTIAINLQGSREGSEKHSQRSEMSKNEKLSNQIQSGTFAQLSIGIVNKLNEGDKQRQPKTLAENEVAPEKLKEAPANKGRFDNVNSNSKGSPEADLTKCTFSSSSFEELDQSISNGTKSAEVGEKEISRTPLEMTPQDSNLADSTVVRDAKRMADTIVEVQSNLQDDSRCEKDNNTGAVINAESSEMESLKESSGSSDDIEIPSQHTDDAEKTRQLLKGASHKTVTIECSSDDDDNDPKSQKDYYQHAFVEMGNGLFPQVLEAANMLLRMFWLLAYFALFVAFAIQMYTLTTEYLSFNVDTFFEVVQRSHAEFPSVTVCNANSVRKSTLSRITKYKQLVELDKMKTPFIFNDDIDESKSCAKVGYLFCPGTKKCIPEHYKCDRIEQCDDGWDEGSERSGSDVSCTISYHSGWEYCDYGYQRCSEAEPICVVNCDGRPECSNWEDDLECNEECGDSEITLRSSSTRTISSPNYPKQYPIATYCRWTIKAPEGEVVRLSFQEYPFAIHADKGRCLLDYVTLFDGKENSARSKIPVNGRYRICGRRAPKSAIFSTGRFMTVRFYSAPRAHYTINTINESFVLETMSHKYSIYKGFNASLTAVRASGNVIETSQYDLNQASNENDDYISEYNIDPATQHDADYDNEYRPGNYNASKPVSNSSETGNLAGTHNNSFDYDNEHFSDILWKDIIKGSHEFEYVYAHGSNTDYPGYDAEDDYVSFNNSYGSGDFGPFGYCTWIFKNKATHKDLDLRQFAKECGVEKYLYYDESDTFDFNMVAKFSDYDTDYNLPRNSHYSHQDLSHMVNDYDWTWLYRLSTSPDLADFKEFSSFTEEEITWFGHQEGDFIVHCTFQGRKCDLSSITRIPNAEYGNCLTVNSGRNQSNSSEKVLSTSRTGQNSGLKMILFLDIDNYVGTLSPNAGAHVLINPSSMPPLPELESILVSPGTASVFSLRKKEVKRLAEPYGNCSKHWPTDKINFSPEFIQQWPVYNQKVCEHYCRQRYLFDKCSCVKTFFPSFKSRSGPSVGNTICSMWNETQADCLARVNEDFRRGIVVCPCNNECNEVTFSSTLSSSDWPSENFVRYLVDKLHRSAQSDVIVNILESEPNLTKEVLQRNFLQIEVYFSNLNFEQVSERPSYTMTSLVTDFGGNIGLWIGWSILSMLEVFVLFFNITKISITGRP